MLIRPGAATALAALAISLTMACGGSGPSSPSSSSGTAPTLVRVVATASVMVAGKPTTILVDSRGMTLYYFIPDKGGKVTCTAGCIAVWPPLLLPADQTTATGGSGVTGTLSTVANPDGKGTQVVYNNWPLYYFAKDKNPGDATGENVAGKWHVVPPDLAPGA